jgi:hypothetical protein
VELENMEYDQLMKIIDAEMEKNKELSCCDKSEMGKEIAN